MDYVGWAYSYCGGPTDKANALPDRIEAMPTKRGARGYAVHEEPGGCRADRVDADSDEDTTPPIGRLT